jgi:hypothetical protein
MVMVAVGGKQQEYVSAPSMDQQTNEMGIKLFPSPAVYQTGNGATNSSISPTYNYA